MPRDARVAWVTGAAGGIGAAVVSRLAADGYAVFATDLQPSSGGPAAAWSRLDVTDEGAVGDAARACREQFGRIDCVVHLAGRVGRGRLAETSLADWQSVLDVNLTSAFLVARAAHAPLRESQGTLVLTSSSNALNGGSALSGAAYAVSKAGVMNLTRYLAREWAPDRIRVNCVAPGPIDTPMLARLDEPTRRALVDATPLGRVGTADDVAAAVSYLASPGASFLTGTVHNVSGGLLLD